jgi:hypothetical protein
MDEQYIMMDECCMKKTMKDLVKTVINKSLTDVEALLLCVYQMTLLTTICLGIIQFQIVARCLVWILVGVIPNHIIIMTTIFINIMFLIQIIENIRELVVAFLCKCDHRQHPELVEE